MRRASLVEVKNSLSEFVDAAEHRGESTIIQRHGKPAAVLVPVSAVAPKKKAKPRMTKKEIEAMFAKLAKYDDPDFSAVQDTIDGRR